MDEIIKLSDTVIHLEHGMVQQRHNTCFIFYGYNAKIMRQRLTGDIVSVENSETGTFTIVLIE